MAARIVFKQPQDIMIRGFDWTAHVARYPTPPTITASDWAADAGLTVGANGIDGLSTSAQISGGTIDQDYWVENTATFSNGAKESHGFWVKVRDKL